MPPKCLFPKRDKVQHFFDNDTPSASEYVKFVKVMTVVLGFQKSSFEGKEHVHLFLILLKHHKPNRFFHDSYLVQRLMIQENFIIKILCTNISFSPKTLHTAITEVPVILSVNALSPLLSVLPCQALSARKSLLYP